MTTQPDDGVDAATARLARGFAAQVERWALASGASPEAATVAARAAEAASLATAAGHTCTALSSAFGDRDAAATRERLLGSGVVTTPALRQALPLVLDDDGRIYLHRYFDHERRLARRLVAAARTPPVAPTPEAAARLAQRFAPPLGTPAPGPDWQRVAAALALERRLTVISGGPGTGKTTTVVNLLACLIERDPACRIALAAPTGKAAARMMEAVTARASTLPPAVRDRLPAEAQTIHRLLGVRPRGGGFRHHAGERLPIDVLVVDEASMLDLALAAELLDAVPDDARIVLLGDKDQLAAVEAGAVFAEVSADPSLDDATRASLAAACGIDAARIVPPSTGAPPTPLANTTIWFTHTHRFAEDTRIGVLAQAIRAGDAAAALALLRDPADASLRWLDGDAELAAALRDGFAAFVDALCTQPSDVGAVARAFDRFRVLCAVRDGPRGMHALNRQCEDAVRSALGATPAPAGSAWFPGRPVMVLRNDYVLKLFNGDVGLALRDATGELQVHFARPDGTFRAVAPARLPEHETAFAITVHKAQGSEFDRVAVVLPERPSAVVTRELLYTAATRARRQVTLCASAALIERAVATPTRRHTGLLARLRECDGP